MSHYQIHRLWDGVSPILSTNLVYAGIVDASFNEVLTRVAVAAFKAFSTGQDEQDNGITPISGGSIRRQRQRHSTKGESSNNSNFNAPTASINSTLNNSFFEYQRTHGYRLAIPSISNCKSVQRLEEDLFVAASIHYLQNAVDANRVAKQISMGGEFSIDMWAAVQSGRGAYHAFHVHEGAIVSGVYYSACPVGCAPLVLRKPFLDETLRDEKRSDNRIFEDSQMTQSKSDIETKHEDDVVIHPKEGDLVLFPPWMKHGVPLANKTPGQVDVASSDKSRVSWAFNLNARLVNMGNPWDITRQSKFSC